MSLTCSANPEGTFLLQPTDVLMAVLDRKAPLVWLFPHLVFQRDLLFSVLFEQMNVTHPDDALAELGLIEVQDYIAKIKIFV